MAKFTKKQALAINKGRKKAGLKQIAFGILKKKPNSGTKKTKSAKPKKAKNNTKSMTKKKGGSKRGKNSIFSKIPSPVKKIAAGVGLATIATVVVSQVAPQAAPVVRPVAAFVGGGPLGLIAELFLNGGLSNITNIFGGGAPQEQGVSV